MDARLCHAVLGRVVDQLGEYFHEFGAHVGRAHVAVMQVLLQDIGQLLGLLHSVEGRGFQGIPDVLRAHSASDEITPNDFPWPGQNILLGGQVQLVSLQV